VPCQIQWTERALIESNDITIIGDLNQNMKQANQSMELRDLMDMFGFKNLITSPTCYKNPHNHTLVDVLLSNNPRKYCSSGIIQNGLSDVHQNPA
jgi:predicted phosphohydrolase